MKRNIDLKEISDGRLYTANDMVKTECHDCVGCSACCRGMGESVVLDPMDIHRLCTGLGSSFEELLQDRIELNVVDGVTLPNLIMKDTCGFLNEDGRCSVHKFRPGICRLFPLGRYYEEEGFKYFLQVHECPANNKGKVKVKKWLDIPELNKYEKYIFDWHKFQVSCQKELSELSKEQITTLNMLILKTFYQQRYGEDFFQEFYARLDKIKDMLGILE